MNLLTPVCIRLGWGAARTIMESQPKPKDTFEERQKRIDRILAGTDLESEWSPELRKYAEERKYLYTGKWITPSVEDKA